MEQCNKVLWLILLLKYCQKWGSFHFSLVQVSLVFSPSIWLSNSLFCIPKMVFCQLSSNIIFICTVPMKYIICIKLHYLKVNGCTVFTCSSAIFILTSLLNAFILSTMVICIFFLNLWKELMIPTQQPEQQKFAPND